MSECGNVMNYYELFDEDRAVLPLRGLLEASSGRKGSSKTPILNF